MVREPRDWRFLAGGPAWRGGRVLPVIAWQGGRVLPVLARLTGVREGDFVALEAARRRFFLSGAEIAGIKTVDARIEREPRIEPGQVDARVEPGQVDARVEPGQVDARVEPGRVDARVEPARVDAAGIDLVGQRPGVGLALCHGQ
jgi:hypothetical protein